MKTVPRAACAAAFFCRPSRGNETALPSFFQDRRPTMACMKNLVLAFALTASFLPLAIGAQEPPGPPGDGPPPEMRAQMEQLRTQAQTNAMNALSADHRAKVQAIVAQVEGGSLSREDATKQIDALLTPDESRAVLAQGQKMHEAMQAVFTHSPRPNHRTPDAGMLLLMLNRHFPGPPDGGAPPASPQP